MAARNEYCRWISNARRTLESAEGDRERGDHNWACFKAQQAGEMSVKGLMWGMGLQPRGHSVSHLLAQLAKTGIEANGELVECARFLDSLYIPTRYADAWAEGAPFEYYDEPESEKALLCARALLEWVKEQWRKYSGEERSCEGE